MMIEGTSLVEFLYILILIFLPAIMYYVLGSL